MGGRIKGGKNGREKESEEKVKERKDGMQVRENGRDMGGWLGGEASERGRWMIGYPSHPRPHSTNIRVGGIYSYKLSAGAS